VGKRGSSRAVPTIQPHPNIVVGTVSRDRGGVPGRHSPPTGRAISRPMTGSSGGPSTPRLLGQSLASLEYWVARSSRAMTAGVLGCLKNLHQHTRCRPGLRAGTHNRKCPCYQMLERQAQSQPTAVVVGPGVRRDDDSLSSRAQQKSPRRGFSHSFAARQCASAQTFFLVKYMSPEKMTRKTKTCRPRCLRASMCGSAVHVRKVTTS
jgi:hypothetical protein